MQASWTGVQLVVTGAEAVGDGDDTGAVLLDADGVGVGLDAPVVVAAQPATRSAPATRTVAIPNTRRCEFSVRFIPQLLHGQVAESRRREGCRERDRIDSVDRSRGRPRTFMVEITGIDQHELWGSHGFPPVEQVRPLVWSVPIDCTPLPVRYTLCYLVANTAGQFVIIDPGWESELGRQQLLAGVERAGLSLANVTGIVVTHFHPDHLGMVRELAEMTGAWVGMHPAEGDYLRDGPSLEQALRDDQLWLARAGVPEDQRADLAMKGGRLAHFLDPILPDLLLPDGASIPLDGRDLRVIWTPGHTGGHLCIVDVDSEVILTGDHVLPRISPNVGLGFFDGDRDPIGEYYASLESMMAWDAFEVLPAHEWRFRGLAERSAELREHHEARSREVAGILESMPDATPWQVAERLTWSRGWVSLDGDNLRAALSESVAHIHHLEV